MISAVYVLACDKCSVRAERAGTEYRTRAAAVAARERVARHDGWLLRHVVFADLFLCPECAAVSE